MDQMVECEFCGTEVSGGSAFTCTYCHGTFCPAHRLPFNHACPNIEEWRSKPATRKVTRQKSGSGILIDQKGLVAGGVLMLALIIVFLLLFRVL
jgi:hypothetical protein